MSVINNKYDFSIFFDVQNGNPNGDPDANNMPRIDPETGYGIVTDVCIKRKIRNYVEMVKKDSAGYDIYIRKGAVLNDQDRRALDELGIKNFDKEVKGKKTDIDIKVRDFMCRTFFDIRTFGAVMTTFVKGTLNSGQVRGPVQLCFAQSIDPVVPRDITLTRVAINRPKEKETASEVVVPRDITLTRVDLAIAAEAKEKEKSGTMGEKYIIPYGLYRMDGFVSANLARTTGFSQEDLQILWESIINMFEDDHSAARGKMVVRKLFVFKHDSIYGNAPSWKLFDSIKVRRKDSVTVPRCFEDYEIDFDANSIPRGVSCSEMI